MFAVVWSVAPSLGGGAADWSYGVCWVGLEILFKCPNVAIGSVCRLPSTGGRVRNWDWVSLEIL